MPNLVSLTIVNLPNKIHYRAGDRFERYGMRVRADYSDVPGAEIAFYEVSPSGPLTESDTQVTVSFMGKTATQPISVEPVGDDGYFPSVCLRGAELGGNPRLNAGDASVRYSCRPIVSGEDTYETVLVLMYCSGMTDGESDLIRGLPKGWRTNFHRFLVRDGRDGSGNPVFKYIDGDGYTCMFRFDALLGGYIEKDGLGLFLSPTFDSITDMKGNTMTFDAQGRLTSVSEASGKTTAVEYNESGLRKVYDTRSPLDFIKLSYDASSSLRWVRVFKDGVERRIYDIMGTPWQISSIRESANGLSRELHAFSVNDRDRVNRMVDALTGEAYRVTYEFEPFSFNGYIAESIRKGHMAGQR